MAGRPASTWHDVGAPRRRLPIRPTFAPHSLTPTDGSRLAGRPETQRGEIPLARPLFFFIAEHPWQRPRTRRRHDPSHKEPRDILTYPERNLDVVSSRELPRAARLFRCQVLQWWFLWSDVDGSLTHHGRLERKRTVRMEPKRFRPALLLFIYIVKRRSVKNKYGVTANNKQETKERRIAARGSVPISLIGHRRPFPLSHLGSSSIREI
ncbi:hypothetical protein B0T26DRAFT_173664 [Lasiosphaeria miniovina]|uniref:Uncharacterized protein n=1 Tax=Lasiosphaeria miniovina TaxID=1954250 RepID=A0AA40B696_9PEZI|nr:uncharacterized protein B0T26DRAFT_173664 [Lasiosphaeria miniovina]KAK0728486.1 hypothetical protein B0T26DRAFT_173664 [Lasiosphaeria miniovina]